MGSDFHDEAASPCDDRRRAKRAMWAVLHETRDTLRERLRTLDGSIERTGEWLEKYDCQWLAEHGDLLAGQPDPEPGAEPGSPAWEEENTGRVFNQAVSLRCSEEDLALFDDRTQALARHARGLDAGGRTDPRDIIQHIKSKLARGD